MKKIAIMTYHDMINYGSFYQMYSLQQYLKRNGYDATVVNYKIKMGPIKKIINNNYGIKKIWLIINNDKLWIKFSDYYNKFIKKTKVVSTNKELISLNSKFNYFIAGSDQIWSPNHFDIHFFLDYVNDDNIRIAYAPSVVIDMFNKSQIEEASKQLEKFKYISVREKTTHNIINKNFSIQPKIVLDPTFIISTNELNKLIPKKDLPKYKTISYFIGENENYNEKVIKIANAFGTINNICIDKNKFHLDCANNLDSVSPGEFLHYISNCETIMTDSYHGVVLAIKYKKMFIVFDRFKKEDPMNQNSRIDDLLELLNIKGVNYNDYINNDYTIVDYKKVEKKLNKLIKDSTDYLLSALSD